MATNLFYRKRAFVLSSCAIAFFFFPEVSTGNVHEEIAGPLTSSPAVTAVCLSCHQKQADDIIHSTHWTWERERTINGEKQSFAKNDSLSTYAIAPGSNPKRCLNCHIKLPDTVDGSEMTDHRAIDCLICHDSTGQYTQDPRPSSMAIDFTEIAHRVDLPDIENCLACHGRSCGLTGNSPHPMFIRDVHLLTTGAQLTCQHCHPGNGRHAIERQHSTEIGRTTLSGCATCHTESPHNQNELNRHADLIACQTCHIPTYDATEAAPLHWNWLLKGSPPDIYQTGDMQRRVLIDTNGFLYGRDIEPIYLWDDGNELVYLRGTKIQAEETTSLQKPGPRSAKSRITPFRVQSATQLYDTKYRYLISPQLNEEHGTLFVDTEWNTIARLGMEGVRLPYSGQYGFTTTRAYKRLNHGVLPADQALDCLDCHGKTGRMLWPTLGYEQDPWSSGSRQPTTRTPVPIAPPLPQTLPPIEETVLPGNSSM